jgi:hypothetical protein
MSEVGIEIKVLLLMECKELGFIDKIILQNQVVLIKWGFVSNSQNAVKRSTANHLQNNNERLLKVLFYISNHSFNLSFYV